LRSSDAVKRSRENVSGTVSIAFVAVVVVVVVVAVVVAVVAVVAVIDDGMLRLAMLAQDIESVFRCTDNCLHCNLMLLMV
jgi:hypothetical protein